jgi:hypothetical protein
MKYGIGVFLLFAISALSQTVNPKRFTATQTRQDGPVAHLHGKVVMRVMSAVIKAEDAAFDCYRYEIAVHGDSLVNLLDVWAQPDGDFPSFVRHSPTDPRRYRATEVTENGTTKHLRGNVTMVLPGIIVTAEDAEVDSSAKTIAIHGDSRFVFLKANIQPDDQLGRFVLEQ